MTVQGSQLRGVSVCASDATVARQTSASVQTGMAVVGPGARARLAANQSGDDFPAAHALSTVRRRALAWMLDFLISLLFTGLLIVAAIVAIAIFNPNALSAPSSSPPPSSTAASSDSPLEYGFVWVGWLTFLVLSDALFGTTPGKLALDLRVVDRSGQTARFWRRLVRILSWPFEIYPPVALILAKVTPNKQRLGDIVAGTYVVRRSLLSHRVGGIHHRSEHSEIVLPGRR